MRSGRGHTASAAKPQLTVGFWKWKPVLVLPTTLQNGGEGQASNEVGGPCVWPQMSK